MKGSEVVVSARWLLLKSITSIKERAARSGANLDGHLAPKVFGNLSVEEFLHRLYGDGIYAGFVSQRPAEISYSTIACCARGNSLEVRLLTESTK